MRASDIAFITNFSKCDGEKMNERVIFSFKRTYFSLKKAKQEQKAN